MAGWLDEAAGRLSDARLTRVPGPFSLKGEKGVSDQHCFNFKKIESSFPSVQGVKTLCFQCRGHRFDPWLRN